MLYFCMLFSFTINELPEELREKLQSDILNNNAEVSGCCKIKEEPKFVKAKQRRVGE